ncbi:hypothetical protein [Photobacterium toruni]|nr:hypothetical protein [Photobacterium toruni]MEC6817149.1 hypothetical protein [Photobacterium toruni]
MITHKGNDHHWDQCITLIGIKESKLLTIISAMTKIAAMVSNFSGI